MWSRSPLGVCFGYVLFPLLAVSLLGLAGCASEPPLPPKAIQLNHDGAAALAAGDLETAEARLALALEYNPRFTEARVNLGLVEMSRGDFKGARRDLLKAREVNPDIPAPHHALGVLAERRERPSEAEKHYRDAIKVDPGFAPSRANLGRCLFTRGAYEEAREQFLRLTEIDPTTLDGFLGLVESELRLGRESDADRTLARARRAFGDRPEIVLLVARQLLRRGAYDDAEAVLAPLTDDADRPRRGTAWGWIAVARASRGDRASAASAVREALAIDPRDEIALHVAGALGR